MNDLNKFCSIIKTRSNENKESFYLLFSKKHYGNCISILRQELDSMIRVIYLLSIKNLITREELIKMTLSGLKWTKQDESGKKKNITDYDMVNLSNNLKNWTKSVYKFGCSFIHLSKFHDLGMNDPFIALTNEEKLSIIEHMSFYHCALLTDNSTINDIIPYLPNVFEKIKSNMDCYLKELEENKQLS